MQSRDTDRDPLRSGWLDTVMLRYVNMINAFSGSVSISRLYLPFMPEITICNIKNLTTDH